MNQSCPSEATCQYSGAAEGGNYTMNCLSGTVIKALSAPYGAPGKTISCLPYVKQQCQTKASCSVQFSNTNCGSDPAPGLSKSATIELICNYSGSQQRQTAAGVPLPQGWSLKQSDIFGTGSGANVTNFTQLHAKYYEAQFYNRNSNGLVLIPNVVINGEQETYSHFENVIVFDTNHLTIQARGHRDNSITSGEMVSLYTARSFCIEAKYKIPNVLYGWPAFWQYASAPGNDASELDFEQPITANQGVHDVTMHNHPSEGSNIQISDPNFTTQYMNDHNPAFDGSTEPHTYTSCYNDSTQQISRFIDGKPIYTATWIWNQSLGGTGHGPDACAIVNLAVGGNWPGNTPNPSAYSANFEVYSIRYYGP
jgi:hypothetical protein